MSLWTPSGEHPVRDEPSGGTPTADTARGAGGSREAQAGGDGGDDAGETGDAAAFRLRQELADTPAEVVVANHCYGLFELAAVYLSSSPPSLHNARLAIDALGSIVDTLGERLGEAHPSLRDALAQIRLAYVQIAAAEEERQGGTHDGDGPSPA